MATTHVDLVDELRPRKSAFELAESKIWVVESISRPVRLAQNRES